VRQSLEKNCDRFQRTHTGYAEFIRDRDWDHYCTLTTRVPVSSAALRKQFDRWISKLARLARRQPYFVVFVESSPTGRNHIHALLGGTGGVPIELLDKAWDGGFSRIAVYNPAGGAAGYVSKFVLSEHTEWDVSANLPRPRRNSRPGR
jgi:hypothetical protein